MSNLALGALESDPKILAWKRRLERGGCTLHSLEPLHVVTRRRGGLLFGMFHARATDSQGAALLPIVLIRGDACVIVPLVRNRATGLQRFAMVRQMRIGSGASSLEFPAGMLDENIDDPRSVAARELAEETGLAVDKASLVSLHSRELFSSSGLQDEAIHFFGCCIDLDDDEFGRLEGRRTGDHDEGERITVTLATREQARSQTSSAQVLLGMLLFDECMGNRQ